MNRPNDRRSLGSPSAGAAAAVVPAAGRSRRMGRAKPLLPFAGDTVLASVLEALLGGGVGRVTVVIAPEAEEPTAREIAEQVQRAGQQVAVNPDRGRGMLSSIRVGLEAAGLCAEAGRPVLVCPADLPALSSTTVAAVLAALDDPRAALALPTVDGKRGHPLAIAPHLLPEIDRLDQGIGLRQLLDEHPDELVTVAVDDPGAIRDVDTPDQYRSLLEDLQNRAKPR